MGTICKSMVSSPSFESWTPSSVQLSLQSCTIQHRVVYHNHEITNMMFIATCHLSSLISQRVSRSLESTVARHPPEAASQELLEVFVLLGSLKHPDETNSGMRSGAIDRHSHLLRLLDLPTSCWINVDKSSSSIEPLG